MLEQHSEAAIFIEGAKWNDLFKPGRTSQFMCYVLAAYHCCLIRSTQCRAPAQSDLVCYKVKFNLVASDHDYRIHCQAMNLGIRYPTVL